MKMANRRGEQIYLNCVEKNGRIVWLMQAIGDTVIIGRDKQRLKSRVWAQEHQCNAYLKRHGYEVVW